MTLNTENLDKLIKHLQRIDRANFNFGHWIGPARGAPVNRAAAKDEMKILAGYPEGGCGTSACLAGHAHILRALENDDRYALPGDSFGFARDWLGLDQQQAKDLFTFTGPAVERSLHNAIITLKYLKETGNASWPDAIAWAESNGTPNKE